MRKRFVTMTGSFGLPVSVPAEDVAAALRDGFTMRGKPKAKMIEGQAIKMHGPELEFVGARDDLHTFTVLPINPKP